ncbi:hypothetical protein PV327_002984 [Microctonus hyperodae]|uniref:Uncharacterized protein n=1 Tax=Microctonus hyperodae TaxID=165561 RepID=A0AA39G3H8_MICHY|nr:hypothetical protein PV327_002984 [Microctonus hyperodae]
MEKTTKKTHTHQNKNDLQEPAANTQTSNFYEHLLSTQEDDSESVTTETRQSNSKPRPLPIYAANTSISKIIELTKNEKIEKNNFHLKQRNDSNIIIYARDITTYDVIKKVLEEPQQ